jgi:hypothetical protein
MRYMFMYYGTAPDSDEERDAGMKEMADWYGELGSAIVDGGNPFIGAKIVGSDGVKDGPMGQMATGYTIVEAPGWESATSLARSCPLVRHGREIQVLEILPMM